MRVFNEFLNEYGAKIIYLIVTMLIGYIGIVAKSLMQRIANDKTKKDIVAVCVKAVEQIYTDLHGDAKLRKCIDKVSDILRNKGIEVSEEEIYMLIESSVKDMNMAMKDVFYSQPETELEPVVETTDEVQE